MMKGWTRNPRHDRGWVMRFAHEKRRSSQRQRPFAECLKEAWATAREIAEGEAMRADRARRLLFAPERCEPSIADYVARFRLEGARPHA
jgi:hypothetical protein